MQTFSLVLTTATGEEIVRRAVSNVYFAAAGEFTPTTPSSPATAIQALYFRFMRVLEEEEVEPIQDEIEIQITIGLCLQLANPTGPVVIALPVQEKRSSGTPVHDGDTRTSVPEFRGLLEDLFEIDDLVVMENEGTTEAVDG